ncbi:peptide/nickel transport system ATP-binding protein [Kribbella voronezhensis]|uniref:Peptide/nickel transport system ATP-binding protein n=1 Tax=Kribbella voronezhensis TaxID=2512212 RepID=A0A4V3FIS4_9ACTN|nr:ABC transporter ATP-binding protein [Kribbella voronezhensis]TDU83583.1 peptide/nickel transport system ATP-binding protein [Kribbella voronezhensis]
MSVIELQGVEQRFHARGTPDGYLTALKDATFTLQSEPPQIVSLVGQSGSGKSTIARNILGLQKPTAGTISFDGKDIFKLSRTEYDNYRRNVQPVFQDPYSIFNPFYRVDRVLWKAVKKFGLAPDRAKGLAMIEESLDAVSLDPAGVLGRYPHQLSGGQRQRIMLARIHMLRPAFVIADEPVSMLDAQIRKTFLDILLDFRRDHGMTTLFITHDLSTVYYLGGDVMVINKGTIVERGAVESVMHEPSHPYTRLLLDSIPQPDPDQRWTNRIHVDDSGTQTPDSAPQEPVV